MNTCNGVKNRSKKRVITLSNGQCDPKSFVEKKLFLDFFDSIWYIFNVFS